MRDDLIQQRTQLQTEATDLRDELITWQIRADVQVLHAGPQTASYYTPQASWRTTYDVRLQSAPDAATGQITLEHQADIFQNTGEDWLGLSARLHAGNAQELIYTPTLLTWHVGPRHASPNRLGEEGVALELVDVAPASRILSNAQATPESLPRGAVYHLEHPLTLTSATPSTSQKPKRFC